MYYTIWIDFFLLSVYSYTYCNLFRQNVSYIHKFIWYKVTKRKLRKHFSYSHRAKFIQKKYYWRKFFPKVSVSIMLRIFHIMCIIYVICIYIPTKQTQCRTANFCLFFFLSFLFWIWKITILGICKKWISRWKYNMNEYFEIRLRYKRVYCDGSFIFYISYIPT